ncbi:MAG TPA: 50S ribosomal protein L6 [Anaerolineales bacterium]
MSRIGRMPVVVPPGVTVEVDGLRVRVKGPKGELERIFRSELTIRREGDSLRVEPARQGPEISALHGMTRALLRNMVAGVHEGFAKILEIDGVGYRAELDGKDLVLHVGFSHPVRVPPPPGIGFEVDGKTRQILVRGADRELVGQVAADVRKVRPPEPYKGKGIHYLGEHIRRKAGKAGKVA